MAEGKQMPTDPSLLLVHEDRISKVEEKQGELQADIKVIEQKVVDGFDRVVEKLDEFKVALINHAAEDKATAAKVYEVAEQVQSIDRKQKQRLSRWEAFWKYAWAVILVILGAAAKFTFDHFTK